ncbi:TMEM175 family protein [Cytophagales bacterium LB-30]|uniref:TMEM175 family protein n=1 Tax=Shiella aurantiaca TaxID=3058365 RepID=A0ABT8F3M2_9BACT|nr:TMEM175 family protein [Shiella aurantiaca]MDN4165058.1 TMEM175 family protein [Shiella aurantiaca]
MLRKNLSDHGIGMNNEFRNRGEGQTRIEAFSDAIFALAITLLLISSKAPQNFQELKQFTNEIIPFAICLVLLTLIWWEHFVFFIRYGFKNRRIVVYNTLLLFIVLFYVYPLKFLTKYISLLFGGIFHRPLWQKTMEMAGVRDVPYLMIIYGLGAAAIFLVLALMYHYAYKQREALELNAIETFDTKTSIKTNILMASIPLISCLLAFLSRNTSWAGFTSGFVYFLYFPVMFIHAFQVAKARQKILHPPKNEE